MAAVLNKIFKSDVFGKKKNKKRIIKTSAAASTRSARSSTKRRQNDISSSDLNDKPNHCSMMIVSHLEYLDCESFSDLEESCDAPTVVDSVRGLDEDESVCTNCGTKRSKRKKSKKQVPYQIPKAAGIRSARLMRAR